mgnify:CR=1 FL=1
MLPLKTGHILNGCTPPDRSALDVLSALLPSTLHRSASVQQPSMAREIIDGVVQRKTVIPHNQLTLSPGNASREFTAGHVLIQKLEQRFTFLRCHADEPCRKHPVKINALFTGIRVRTASSSLTKVLVASYWSDLPLPAWLLVVGAGRRVTLWHTA